MPSVDIQCLLRLKSSRSTTKSKLQQLQQNTTRPTDIQPSALLLYRYEAILTKSFLIPTWPDVLDLSPSSTALPITPAPISPCPYLITLYPPHQHLPVRSLHASTQPYTTPYSIHRYCTHPFSYLQSYLSIQNNFSPNPSPHLPYPSQHATFRNAILVITPTYPINSTPAPTPTYPIMFHRFLLYHCASKPAIQAPFATT